MRVGVDLVSVDRIARLVADNPDILATIFTERELALCGQGRHIERMAGRVAAKEAVLKAIGAGLLTAIELIDIEVDSSPSGRPVARLHGAAAAWADANRMIDADVSISHTAGLAMAQALVVCDRGPAST